MKPSLRFVAALGLWTLPLAMDGAGIAPSAYQPLRINQTWEPDFPIQATNLDLTSGDANVMVTVDGDGRLTDSLVVSYSHPAFAAMAVLALSKWSYEPARLDGQPLITTKEVAFRFEEHGVVLVTETAAEAIESKMQGMTRNEMSYRAYTLNEIDRPPTPIHLVSPAYPTELEGERNQRHGDPGVLRGREMDGCGCRS